MWVRTHHPRLMMPSSTPIPGGGVEVSFIERKEETFELPPQVKITRHRGPTLPSWVSASQQEAGRQNDERGIWLLF